MTTSEVESPATRPVSGPHHGGTASWLHGRWVMPSALAVLGVVLFFAYLAEASKLPIFADGSSQALQARDILHGNLLLHGWVLSDVSFYTTEIPQYMFIELFRGLNPDVVHIAGAMTYALLVVLTAALAKGKATGREALVRVLIPVGIMIAPSIGGILSNRATSPAWIFFSAPDHTGTQVPLVLIWLLLDRVRPRWWMPVVVGVLLTLVVIADSTAIYEGALPIAAVGAVRMYRRRGPLEGQRYDLSLTVAALASVVVARETLAVIRSAGGFIVNPASPALASVNGLAANFWLKIKSILALFNADFFGLTVTHAVTPLAHLIAVALVVWAVVIAVRRFFADDDLAMQVVTASLLLLLAAYIFGYRTGAREAVGLLPMGAVLAGRMLAARVLQFKLAPALAAVLAFYVLSFGYHAADPALPSPPRPLASWLRAHNLTYGLSTTWYASNGVTLYSQDHVQVRDVKIAANGGFKRVTWNTKASWYDPSQHDARFAILNPCAPTGLASLVEANGRPSATYFVDDFTVLVWNHNLLASQQAGALPFAGQPSPRELRGLPKQSSIGNKFTSEYKVLCGSR